MSDTKDIINKTAEDSLLVGNEHELVRALAEPRPRMGNVRLRAVVMTVGRLFDALDEVADKLHAPRTIPPSPAVIVCQELKRVLTEQITKEYEGGQ